ncbi:SGT1 protein-domain-containing protein [Staphylotrichum tortipilum]|uniref:SGT1 protein-domain-containing protein n=1 Tax=Staphylotrichum tortipilum TaxID=2831512 RepID=A0AAN6MSR5_9PEZI|nr:SGT1 protein-domain-containing protein [Staphylotrichum longicolle]
MDTEPRPGDEDFVGFRMRLSEDCVEYMLFVIGDSTAGSSNPSLETVRKAADQKLSELAKDYIWQRDPFKLETKVQKGLGLPYLHGTTHYGDNVEDEWLIVYMLRELSKAFPSLWIRVSDSDGEFLLIEAAKVTPKWISPENDGNRVWIHDGKLLLIPVSSASSPASNGMAPPSKPLSLPDAISAIRSSPLSSLVHSPLIEAEVFYRLEKYPAHITASSHRALATIPRKLAYILHARPRSVAPATEAFYLRDPRALKPLFASFPLTFPPTDLVTVSIRFTKVLYAQLKSQHFPPPPSWSSLLHSAEADGAASPPTNSDSDPNADTPAKRLARLDLGMKLTTGFELLARDAHSSPSRVVREVGLLLDDLAEDGGDGALPGDDEMRTWDGAGLEDSDEWMDIDFGDFERELDGKGGEREGAPGFGDAAAQADLRKMVSRFEAFLNDESAGLDGAEVDEMDRDDDEDEDDEDDSDEDGGWGGEDREVSFDEEQFARMMREMMGLPAEDEATGGEGSTKGKRRAGVGQVNEIDDGEEDEEDEEDVEEIRKIMHQMGAELKGHGALELDPKPKTAASIKEKGEAPSKSGPVELKQEDDDDEGSDEAVDIDYNLAKNLLESFKSQAGMAGPAGNLLGLMGMSLPRDEADSDNEKHK